jgi:ferric-dicitrate binding protein FerR (iron transport regulator)
MINQDLDFQKFARYFAKECSEEERKEIEAWIEADPLRREFVESFQKIWEAAGQSLDEWDVDRAWKNVARRVRIHSPYFHTHLAQEQTWTKRFWRKLSATPSVRFALIVVSLVGISYFIAQLMSTQEKAPHQTVMREITTNKGEQARIRLADGTAVLLNAQSLLRVPEKLTGNKREVYLEGEAYFDVKRADDIGFSIQLRNARIEVLGTRFTVHAWPDDNRVRVVVAEGKVSFRSDRAKKPQQVVVTTSEMSMMAEDGTLLPPIRVDLDKQLDWVFGRMEFENTTFREVLKRLERRFNLSFSISDSTMLRRRLTASFKEESLDEILQIITLTLNLRYERKDEHVTFFSRQQQKTEKES